MAACAEAWSVGPPATIALGDGAAPVLAVDPQTGDLHVAFESAGAIKHAIVEWSGTVRQSPETIPGSAIHGGGGSGPPEIAVSSTGEPTIIVNETVFNAGSSVKAYAIAKSGGKWQAPVELADANGPQRQPGKGNRPWEPAAVADDAGNIHVLLTLAMAGRWEESPRIYRKLNGVRLFEAKMVQDLHRSEGGNAIAVRDGIVHFAWANSSSGFFYRTLENDSFSGVVSESPTRGTTGFTCGVAVASDGVAHVVWNTKKATLWSGIIRGEGIEDRVKIDDNARDGGITADAAGNIYVAYYSNDDGKVYIRQRNSATGAWSSRVDFGPSARRPRFWFRVRTHGDSLAIAGTLNGNVFVRIAPIDIFGSSPAR